MSRIKIDEVCFSVLDIESTGLSPRQGDRVIELGITKIDINGRVIDTYETLVNPERKVSAVNIHGITDRMVKNAPLFSEIAAELLQFINNTVIVAHNAGFDMSFIKWEFSNSGYDVSDIPRLCTLIMARKLLPSLPSKKLGRLCDHFGIDSGLAHSALSDSAATAELFVILMNRYNYRNSKNVKQLSLVDYSGRYSFSDAEGRNHLKRSEAVNFS